MSSVPSFQQSVLGQQPQKVWAQGPKVLLLGNEGTGKTDSIRTLVEAGLKVFCVFSEPGMEVLVDPTRGRKVYTCVEGLHWAYFPVAQPSFADLADAADKLNKFSFEALSNMAPQNREKYRTYWQIMACMANLKCDRCSQSFGPADRLPYDEWAVVNDSLTSFSKAGLYGHIGSKPAVHRGEYGVVMKNIESYIDTFVGAMPCMGVMMAHVDKEPNEVTGGFENMVATLGQKLAPKIPRPFSDVVLAKRDKDKFTWSTIDTGYKLKTRNFAFSADLPPTFVPLVKKWKERIEAEKNAAGANQQLVDAIKK